MDLNQQPDVVAEQQEIPSEEDFVEQDLVEQENWPEDQAPKRRRKAKTTDKLQIEEDSLSEQNSSQIYDDNYIIDRLSTDKNKLSSLLSEVTQKIKHYKQIYLKEQEITTSTYLLNQNQNLPICADVTKFDFQNLIAKQLQVAQREFDVIMMDPPWRLSSSQPSRGVAIQYSSLSDEAIELIPVPLLQKNGFIFIWVINAKFQFTVNVMEKRWGYKVVDSINWVKKTVNGKIAKGHGFYLQHAKQTCLVGYKGNFTSYNKDIASDVIFSYRRGQSQKPTEIYEYIEKLVPNGYYLEIFGRRNNLRTNWVTIGNEL